ncbi:MAG: hypothetical protein KF899_02535 [Parvibaculum sp.]|nr:hypothetical protein [Parvibaculum sp.]
MAGEVATLDGANNFIPDDRRLSPQDHMALARRYVEAAFEFIDHYLFEIANMIEVRDGRLSRMMRDGHVMNMMLSDEDDEPEEDHVRRFNWTECTIYRCEIYTELDTPEAIDHVHRVAPVLAAQSLAAQRRDYAISHDQASAQSPLIASRERVSNAPSVTVALGRQDVELSLYAKTTDRTRYEVRYKNNLRRLLGRSAPRRSWGVSDVDGVFELLAVAMEDAAGRLDRVFREVEPVLQTGPRRLPTLVNLLYYISQSASGDRRVLTDLVTLLVREGGVEPENAPHLRAACEYLVSTRARVLRRTQMSVRYPRRRYVLTQRYRPFLEVLRQAIDFQP